jgi:hypothetical protein
MGYFIAFFIKEISSLVSVTYENVALMIRFYVFAYL